MTIRSRSKNNLAPPYALQLGTSGNQCNINAVVTTTYGTSTVFEGSIESMDDTVIPNFRRKQAEGLIFFSPMQRTKTTYTSLRGQGPKFMFRPNTFTIKCNNVNVVRHTVYDLIGDHFLKQVPNATGYASFVTLIPQSDISSLINEACTAVAADRGKADVNSVENLAELSKTIGMLKRPLGSLDVLSRRAEKYRQTLGNIASAGSQTYLAYRYGIRPLVKDIQQILDDARLKRNVPERKTTRKHVSRSLSSTDIVSKTIDSCRFDLTTHCVDTVTVRAMSLDSFQRSSATTLGFSIKGALGTAWELVPWSFVLDWFVGVGDFLYAQLPSPEYKQLGSCYSVKRECVTTYSPSNSVSTDPLTWDLLRGVSGGFTVCYTTTNRVIGLASPSIELRSDFRFDSITRLCDALALVYQRLDRCFR